MVCSTIGPRDVESIAARLDRLNTPCIDAPMSGGPARARDGTMSLMVACADAVFARHEPVLRDLSTRLLRLGERIGDGARTKLVNNLLAGVNLAAAAEALALAERLGLDARRTLQVFEQSSAQSWIGSDRLPRALDGDFEPRAHTSLLAKDTTLAMAMAGDAGLQPLLGATAQQLFARACARGLRCAGRCEPADSDAAMVRRRSQVNCAAAATIRVSSAGRCTFGQRKPQREQRPRPLARGHRPSRAVGASTTVTAVSWRVAISLTIASPKPLPSDCVSIAR